MKQIAKILISCAVYAFGTTAVAVDTYSAQNVSGGQFDLNLRGFMDGYYGSSDTLKRNISMEFDWAEPSAQYLDFSLDYTGDTYTKSTSYTVGPGETKTITTSVYIDPFTVSAAGLEQIIDLDPGEDGLYETHWSSANFDPILLSGRVEVTGPTESVTVPFSHAYKASSGSNFPILLSADTQNYPTSVELEYWYNTYRELYTISYWDTVEDSYTLVDTTVDGIDVNITSHSAFSGSSTGTVNLQAVPEPTSIAMMGVVAGAAVFIRRFFLV